MNSSRRANFYSSSTSTVTSFVENVTSTPKIIQIPIQSPLENNKEEKAAVKIQSAYRSYIVRTLVDKISAVNSEANYLQRLIQRQGAGRAEGLHTYHSISKVRRGVKLPVAPYASETVDAVRSSERERIRMNEALMALLLRLDSVPGVNPTVKELRRDVSRRIVGLQEILDAVSDTKIQNWDGFLMDWDDVVERMEVEVCKERGGGKELEKFCAEHLGFQCLQRFLRDQ